MPLDIPLPDSSFFKALSEVYAELEVTFEPGSGSARPAFPTVKREYRRLCLLKHPDKGGEKEAFQRLQEAWDIAQDVELGQLKAINEAKNGNAPKNDTQAETSAWSEDYYGDWESQWGGAAGSSAQRESDDWYPNKESGEKPGSGQAGPSDFRGRQHTSSSAPPRNFVKPQGRRPPPRRRRTPEPQEEVRTFRQLPRESLLSDFAAHFGIKEKLCDFMAGTLSVNDENEEKSKDKEDDEFAGLEACLAFPPDFTNLDRKYIHQLAESLGLFTKSEGSKQGGSRVIVVYLSDPDAAKSSRNPNARAGGAVSERAMNRWVCENGCDIYRVQMEEPEKFKPAESNPDAVPCPVCGKTLVKAGTLDRGKGVAGGFYERQDKGEDVKVLSLGEAVEEIDEYGRKKRRKIEPAAGTAQEAPEGEKKLTRAEKARLRKLGAGNQ